MSKMNFVCSLAFNLPSEVEKATKRLYEQNENFSHFIFDCGFPITEGDVVPDSIEDAKSANSFLLNSIAQKYGSKYVRIENKGVSQNWSTAIKHIDPDDDDVVIGCDADEQTLNIGWVKAMGDVMRLNPSIGMCCLKQTGVPDIDPQYYEDILIAENIRVWVMKALTNMAQFGFSGKFLNQINRTIPVPEQAGVYGYVEGVLLKVLWEQQMTWCILPQFEVTHEDTVPLYRSWKNYIILENPHLPQLSFEQWLEFKRDGTI